MSAPKPHGELAYRACREGTCDHDTDCPRNGQRWPSYVRFYNEHPPDCASREDMWTPHYGGVSCPSDLDTCDDCQIMFYVEGIRWFEDAAVDPEDGCPVSVSLCDCCLRAREARGERPIAFSVKDPTPDERGAS